MIDDYDYDAPLAFDARYGWLSAGCFPADCIRNCSAGGPVDQAVAFWCKTLQFESALNPLRPLVERYLKEFGAWDDLKTATMETLARRVLWIACGYIAEDGEWEGLVH